MFLPRSRAVAVVLFLVLPEVVSHVWKSPSVIQRTIKKLHCDLQNIHTSFLSPSWWDLNWLGFFALLSFSLFLTSKSNKYQLKNWTELKIELNSTIADILFYSTSSWQSWKVFTVIQKLNWFRWLGDQSISASCWYYLKYYITSKEKKMIQKNPNTVLTLYITNTRTAKSNNPARTAKIITHTGTGIGCGWMPHVIFVVT